MRPGHEWPGSTTTPDHSGVSPIHGAWLRSLAIDRRGRRRTSVHLDFYNYVLNRRAALSIFLADPTVALDTTHLERQIRPIALGRRNWLFCWMEVGARYVGILQSLLASCRLQAIDPYVYLVDVLQRVDTHPAFDVHLLTPRLWKQHFAATPLRSDLDRYRQ